ncbi:MULTISPECIES: hypothetical protein [Virgibacillus]|uniref:Uncharacterized protein n=1 Tax=Virgibacillus pantothenticus TaxID=1473 RepID=A0A0L0QTC3_VIRPA|nr:MULTISPECIES: hypothetical protein [Virgibacillus]API91218.1 hypothetical protein BKP57_04680 [Virgibacillus sp. 6R]KNE21831.1 hypothetical protein AFK71_03200 [Virgibacillus pantothenticus]MBU8568005.1 hypothetical protein [Virgibacillus pantothenticus]MBU8643576.1 hypothetical protein [Virgibacillus pantothenticus]MBU8661537.1 hypothetical protein [Virgibacillus pantothenticus]
MHIKGYAVDSKKKLTPANKVNLQSVKVFIHPPLIVRTQGYDLKASEQIGYVGAVIFKLRLGCNTDYPLLEVGVLQHL